jgi:ribose-phosphate pyrophosphokinase
MPGVAEVMNLIGNVEGKTAIIIDDMVDTAGSLVEGAKALANLGAKEVYACCSHAILSDPAVERIKNSNIKELIVTDSIPLSDAKKCDKIKVQTIAPLLAQAMLKVYTKTSISEIFE